MSGGREGGRLSTTYTACSLIASVRLKPQHTRVDHGIAHPTSKHKLTHKKTQHSGAGVAFSHLMSST